MPHETVIGGEVLNDRPDNMGGYFYGFIAVHVAVEIIIGFKIINVGVANGELFAVLDSLIHLEFDGVGSRQP